MRQDEKIAIILFCLYMYKHDIAFYNHGNDRIHLVNKIQSLKEMAAGQDINGIFADTLIDFTNDDILTYRLLSSPLLQNYIWTICNIYIPNIKDYLKYDTLHTKHPSILKCCLSHCDSIGLVYSLLYKLPLDQANHLIKEQNLTYYNQSLSIDKIYKFGDNFTDRALTIKTLPIDSIQKYWKKPISIEYTYLVYDELGKRIQEEKNSSDIKKLSALQQKYLISIQDHKRELLGKEDNSTARKDGAELLKLIEFYKKSLLQSRNK